MSLRDDLIAAKKLIELPAKWIKGRSHQGGRLCSLGALCSVKYPHYGLRDAAYGALRSALPEGTIYVANFNDHPSTTHADVMALFDRAIARASQSQEGE